MAVSDLLDPIRVQSDAKWTAGPMARESQWEKGIDHESKDLGPDIGRRRLDRGRNVRGLQPEPRNLARQGNGVCSEPVEACCRRRSATTTTYPTWNNAQLSGHRAAVCPGRDRRHGRRPAQRGSGRVPNGFERSVLPVLSWSARISAAHPTPGAGQQRSVSKPGLGLHHCQRRADPDQRPCGARGQGSERQAQRPT